MTVHDLRSRAMSAHPSARPFNPTAKALRIAHALIEKAGVPGDATVTVINDGQLLCFDYTGKAHAAGSIRIAAQACGLVVEELAADCPDGTAAVELRASEYLDGLLRTFRAVVPLPTTWPQL